MDLLHELTRIVAALDTADIPYALAGGWALAVHGAARATTDIDVLVLAEDVPRVLDAVAPLGFRPEAMPMHFPEGMRIQRVSKIDGTELLTLDLLLVSEDLRGAWDSRARYEALGTELSVIGRDALIQMKAWAGRPQDLADIARLEGDDR